MRFLLIALVGVMVEVAVVRNAMGLSLSRLLPVSTRVASASDARTDAAMATQLIASRKRDDALKAQDYAQRALLRDPTIAAAARNGGMAAGILGNERVLRRRLDYAFYLSRRDLPTLLAFIEERVAANDIPGTLRYYDIALRTSRNSGMSLIPVLVQAAGDPEIGPAIVTYIARHRPPWTRSYFETALKTSNDWRVLALLSRGLIAARVPLPDDVTDQAIRTIVDAGHPTEAFDIYLRKHGQTERQDLRNGNFATTVGTSSFDWNLTQDPGRQAVIADGQLQVDVSRDTNGSVARQLLMLRPGRYALRAALGMDGEVSDAMPYWSISCFPRTLDVGQVEAAQVGNGRHGWAGQFTIPANCEAQWLTLNARATDAATTYKVSDVVVGAVR